MTMGTAFMWYPVLSHRVQPTVPLVPGLSRLGEQGRGLSGCLVQELKFIAQKSSLKKLNTIYIGGYAYHAYGGTGPNASVLY